MADVRPIRPEGSEIGLLGTRLMERPPSGKEPGPSQRRRWMRFRRAKAAFFAALQEEKRPLLSGDAPVAEAAPSPIGYLVAGEILLPLYCGTTVITKLDGVLKSGAGSSAGGELVMALQSSRSQSCFHPQGHNEPYHHGTGVLVDGRTFRLALFSTDLWPKEEGAAHE